MKWFCKLLVAISLCATVHAADWKKHEIARSQGSMINSAVASDFDRDGHIDVITSYDGRVVVHQGPDWTPHTVAVFDDTRSRNKPREMCIHSCLLDVDSDGDMDLCGSNNTVFWLECPNEPFSGKHWTWRRVDDEILGTHCLITGDVNQDGRLDLIANSGRAREQTAFPFSIAWFEIPDDSATADAWPRHIFADGDAPGGSHYTGFGDVNGDGRPDIACAAKGGDGFPDGEWFAWWEQPSDSGQIWNKHVLSDNEPGASNIQPVDLDADGAIDYIATRGHGKGVLWFRGPSFERLSIDDEIDGPHCLAVADLDNDGNPDAATCGRETNGVAAWYRNDGSGRFSKHIVGRDQSSYDMRAIDFDKDGDLDLLVAGHLSNNVVWYENPLKGD